MCLVSRGLFAVAGTEGGGTDNYDYVRSMVSVPNDLPTIKPQRYGDILRYSGPDPCRQRNPPPRPGRPNLSIVIWASNRAPPVAAPISHGGRSCQTRISAGGSL